MLDSPTVHRSNVGRHRKIWWVLWALLLLIFLVGLRPPAAQLGYDVAIWTLAARDMSRGSVLYRDIWDNKGPLVFLLFSAVYRLFGHNPVAINSLAIVLMMLVGAGVYCLAWQLLGRFVAGAAVTFLLLAAVFPSGQRVGPELMMHVWMVPAFIATIAGLRRRRTSLLVIGGVLAGLALQVTGGVGIHIAALLLVVASHALWVKHRPALCAVGSAMPTVAGVLLPLAGFAAYFYRLGALSNYVHRWIVDNFAYIAPATAAQADTHPIDFLRNEVISNPVLWLAAMCGALLVIVGIATSEEKWQDPETRWRAGVPIAWAVFSAIAVVLGKRYYPHYLFHAVPPAAILAGLAAQRTSQLLRQPLTRNYALASLLAAGAMGMLSLLPRAGPAIYKWQGLAGVERPLSSAVIAGNWLREELPPGAAVFVWPFQPALYLHSDAEPVNCFYTYWYFDQIAIGPSAFRRYLSSIWQEDLKANSPQYVLLERRRLAQRGTHLEALGLDQLLGKGYVQLADVAGYEVWRRVDRG